jgi:hypothetical protein
VAPEEIVAVRPDGVLRDAWPYGDLYVLEQLWARLGMPDRLTALAQDTPRRTLPVERACFALVANRCCAPASKLYCVEQWLREDVRLAGADALDLHHLSRAMDVFEAHKAALEQAIFFQVADLFACAVELIFYDTTTLHCEIDAEDAGGIEDATQAGSALAGGQTYPALRQQGKAKNKRSDVPHVIVGRAMTRDGLPVRSWVFRGDTVDVETVAQVKADLRGWKLTRSVVVGDAGMGSAANLRTLAAGGGKYLRCMPVKAGNEVSDDVLARPGRYRPVAANLEVKEVVGGDGERRRRYVVCYNAEEAKRQQAHRAQVVAELEAVLPALRTAGAHSKRVCALRTSERYGKYLTQDRHGRLKLDPAKLRQAERLDGTCVVHSNDDTLAPEDLALGYKQLMQVERAWRLLKSGRRIRPLFHWAPQRIGAHVSLTMVALLLERLAERACGTPGGTSGTIAARSNSHNLCPPRGRSGR